MCEDENFLYGRPNEEIDLPLDETKDVDSELEVKRMEDRERERKEKRYFSAFRLIVGCLIFLGIIFAIDTIVTVAWGKTSETTNTIIEIIKTLLFTLSGYLFARKENGD